MDNAGGFKCVICYDSICCDSAKYQSIDLTCGHAFGKSCMRKWIESSNQKECLLCKNPLTDYEIKEIKNIPLQERVIIVSKKAIKLFGQTILNNASFFVAGTVTTFALANAGVATRLVASFAPWLAAGCNAGIVGVAAGVAAGAVCVATGVDMAAARAVCATAGAVGTVGIIGGYVRVNAGAVGVAVGAVGVTARTVGVAFGVIGFTAGAVGVIAGAVGVAAGAIGVTAGAIGAVITAGTFGAAVVAAGAYSTAVTIPVSVGFIVGVTGAVYFIGGGVLGDIGAYAVYKEQEMNPVIV